MQGWIQAYCGLAVPCRLKTVKELLVEFFGEQIGAFHGAVAVYSNLLGEWSGTCLRRRG